MKPGEAFNPWRGACGFYPPDVVSALPPLTVLGTRCKFSDGHKRLYTLLARRAGKDGLCFPRQGDMVKALGKSERAVRRWLDDLEVFGLIRRQARGRGKGGNGQSDMYTFLWHPIFDRPKPSILTGQNEHSEQIMTGHPRHYGRPESTVMTGHPGQSLYKEETRTVETRTKEVPPFEARASEEPHRNPDAEPLSEPAAVVPISLPREQPSPRGYAFDEQFREFERACRDWGMNLVEPDDFHDAYRWEWSTPRMDFQQRQMAIEAVRARIAAGREPLDWKPKNFLKSEYKRELRVSQPVSRHPAYPQYESADDLIRRVQQS